jgi:hypothetical protein
MILDETRERFIKAIAAQVDPSRIAEIHFFAPIKQGGVESGVAVIAADPLRQADDPPHDPELAPQGAAAEGPLDTDGESPYADPAEDSAPAQSDPSEAAPPQDDAETSDVPAPAPIERHVIYTARYRLTLKGPDRGKWETNVTAEADAPIITLDAVVRGVQRRAGDVDDPTRLGGDEIRAALPAGMRGLPAHA